MEHKDYRLAAILFTDIVGFSRMMEKDEAGTLKLMEFHNSLVRDSVASFGGNIIKTIGDAFLIEFSNANNAIRCAIKIQKDLETFNAEKPAVPLVLRIGCHLGDIYFFENDALGEGINIASRLQSLSGPGRICMSQEVYNLVSNKVEIPIRALGVVSLKNITRELHAYEIMTNGSAGDVAPVVSETEPKPQQTSKESTSSAQSASPESGDFNEIRRAVFAAIKRAGRRLTVTEARKELPWKSSEVENVLSVMLNQGFLAKDNVQSAYDNGDDYTSSSDRDYDRSSRRSSRHHGFGNTRGAAAGEIGEVFREIAHEIKVEVSKASEKFLNRRNSLTPDQYLAKQETALANQRKGFTGHLSSYVTVNLGLWFIWFMTMPFGFPWPLIVSLAWGIGMSTHVVNLRQKEKEVAQQKALPALTERQLGMLRSLFKERRGWYGHLSSNLSTIVFLIILNFITSPGFPWSVFPAIGMLVGLVGHRSGLKAKEREILKQMADEGLPIDILTSKNALRAMRDTSSQSVPTSGGPVASEAERLRQRILKQFKGLKGNHPLGDDFVPVLDNYVKQIKELSVRSSEIDSILSGIPIGELKRERETVTSKRSLTTNERMVQEYDKALSQIDKQLHSHNEMSEEQQVLKQRLTNSVNGLKQLEIDIGRVKSMSVRTDLASASSLRDRSDELRQYLQDLHVGYQEAEASASGIDINQEDSTKHLGE